MNNLSVFDQIINDYSSNYKCGDDDRNEWDHSQSETDNRGANAVAASMVQRRRMKIISVEGEV